jgi:hypothetical protein
MQELEATAVFGVIPDKRAIASENKPPIQNVAGISWKTKV